MAKTDKTKAPRIVNAKAITGKAKSPEAAAMEIVKATEGARNQRTALAYLAMLGYGKIAATTKWARENAKPARKPARKAAKAKARKPAKRSKASAAARQTQDPQIAAGMV